MKRRRKRKMTLRAVVGFVVLFVIVILIIASLIRIDNAVKPVAAIQAEQYSKITANEIISEAVSEYLSENRYTYNDFAAVLYNEEGRAVAVESVAYNINKVQSELTALINSEFEKSGDSTAEIPLGSLTESHILAGKGPHIELRICPAREASVTLTSTFDSAGINQTCHRLSINVNADIKSSIPLYTFETNTSFEFLLAENIIVGDVPENSFRIT